MAGVTWKVKLFDADATEVYKCLENIEEKTPQNIVDWAAEHPESELHKCFTWDDKKAANEWRKQEARQVVCQLVFENEETKEPTNIRIMQKSDNEYKPVNMIVRNQDEYEELLKRAYTELQAFKERYKNIVELEEIIDAIDSVIGIKES